MKYPGNSSEKEGQPFCSSLSHILVRKVVLCKAACIFPRFSIRAKDGKDSICKKCNWFWVLKNIIWDLKRIMIWFGGLASNNWSGWQTDETRVLVSLALMKLGSRHMGVHYTLLSTFVYFWNFPLKKNQKWWTFKMEKNKTKQNTSFEVSMVNGRCIEHEVRSPFMRHRSPSKNVLTMWPCVSCCRSSNLSFNIWKMEKMLSLPSTSGIMRINELIFLKILWNLWNYTRL